MKPSVKRILKRSCLVTVVVVAGLFITFFAVALHMFRSPFSASSMKREFNAAGGASAIRAACIALKPEFEKRIEETGHGGFSLYEWSEDKLELDADNPIRKLKANHITLDGRSHHSGVVYNISVGGGFFHAGYLVLECEDQPPLTHRDVDKIFTFKDLGNGVGIYFE